MLKFDLIAGGRHDVPPHEDKTDPKITPKFRREGQIRMLLHLWPNILELFLARMRARQASVGDVCHQDALWHAHATCRMLQVLRAPDLDSKELATTQLRSPGWGADQLEAVLGSHLWFLVIANIFLEIGNGRPTPKQHRPLDADLVFVHLIREIFFLTCRGQDQLERIKRLSKCQVEFAEKRFLHPDFEEVVGWR